MTNDAAFITEVWSLVKSYIPVSERSHVADSLVELFDENNTSHGFEELTGQLGKSVKEYFDYEEEDDDDCDD